MDGVGEISAYHEDLFLGGLREHQIVTSENNALGSTMIRNRIAPLFDGSASHIVRVLSGSVDAQVVTMELFAMWSSTIARLCIGLKRLGTGGAFLLTPRYDRRCISLGRSLMYRRLGDALVLNILDRAYLSLVEDRYSAECDSGTVDALTAYDRALAETDADDRSSELSGAVKFVTSLAALDGVVVMTPELKVVGFGAKIGSAPAPSSVYDGADYSRRRTAARKVDVSAFGTRHGSILRYCGLDRQALGVIVSQDGHVRVAGVWDRSLGAVGRRQTAKSPRLLAAGRTGRSRVATQANEDETPKDHGLYGDA